MAVEEGADGRKIGRTRRDELVDLRVARVLAIRRRIGVGDSHQQRVELIEALLPDGKLKLELSVPRRRAEDRPTGGQRGRCVRLRSDEWRGRQGEESDAEHRKVGE